MGVSVKWFFEMWFLICESRAQNEWTLLGFAGRKNVCSLDVRFFNIEEIVDPQRVLVGVLFCIFSCKAFCFGVYREAQLESKRKRYTFAANNREVKPSLLYICIFEWGNCCKSLGPGS